MVPGWFLWFFKLPGQFSWFFYDFRLVFHGSRSVFIVFHGSRFVFHGSRLVFMVFHGSRLVFRGSRSVFHGFSPKCNRLNCILAQPSSLGPPAGGRYRTK